VLRVVLALLAALALAAVGCGDDSSPDRGAKETAPTAPLAEDKPPATTPGGCKPAPPPEPRDPRRHREPSEPLDKDRDWTLEVKTNCGDFRIALDLEKGPEAAASLVALARSGYFDDTVFHRIVPGYVIQGGDPTATGNGDPGYATLDPPPRNASYTRGVVAMAKTQSEPAGAGGSQFFVVTGGDTGLPPDYAIVGKVSDGIDVVERIGRLGDPSERPTEPVVISEVKVLGR
jgi:peptidyl-prolyl cis-trans isomerase B (cyclophilin B)